MQQALSDNFLRYIREYNLFDKQMRLFVAVSGGIDSVVLCHLLHRQGFAFTIAHCHFGLRGEESDRDAQFVVEMARRLGVSFCLKHFDTAAFAAAQKLSIQEAARKLRYDWFHELCNPANQHDVVSSEVQHPSAVLTAHHLDDNIETVVMNFFKGTGISGLRGILPKQAQLIRPLLFARREELEVYAAEHRLSWVEDSSNAATKYTRNYFRHEVLPLVQQRYPKAMENIAANIRRLGEAEELYQQAVQQHLHKLCVLKGAEVHVPVLKLAKSTPLETITYELLKPFGFKPQQTEAVLQLLQSESGRYVQSATHQVVRHRRWLVIAPLQLSLPSLLVIDAERDTVQFGEHQLKLQEVPVPGSLQTTPETALLDHKKIKFPLVLRRWKPGDYCYPLGLGKKKKISRLLIDLKFSKIEKEQVYVLESGNKIAWVVGIRIDDRFKITPSTQTVLHCSYVTPQKKMTRS